MHDVLQDMEGCNRFSPGRAALAAKQILRMAGRLQPDHRAPDCRSADVE